MALTAFLFDKYSLEIYAIAFLGIISFVLTQKLLKPFGPVFIKAGLHGNDLNKIDKPLL